jgi:hypothetical protein
MPPGAASRDDAATGPLSMDPTVATMLAVAFLAALIISIHETKAALEPPACAECSHCQERARAKAREQDELREAYARKWQLPEEDDRDR